MGYSHGTPGLRLLKFLAQGRGTRTITEISRRQSDGRLLAQARPELDGLITEGAIQNTRSKRPVRRVFLTPRGWAACAALQPGWQPRRLSVAVLKEWFEELRQEGDPWASHWDKENAILREKLAVYEDLKRRGLIYPSPLLRKTRKDAKNPAATLQRDLKRQAREDKRQAPARLAAQIHTGGGFNNPTPGKIPSAAPVPAAPDTANLNQPIYDPAPFRQQPPAAPLSPHEEYLAELGRYNRIAEEATGRRQSYVPRDCKPAPPPDPEIARIKAKAVRLHMADAIRHDGMLYDNRVITFAEWDANVQG